MISVVGRVSPVAELRLEGVEVTLTEIMYVMAQDDCDEGEVRAGDVREVPEAAHASPERDRLE